MVYWRILDFLGCANSILLLTFMLTFFIKGIFCYAEAFYESNKTNYAIIILFALLVAVNSGITHFRYVY
jgi:hypothetical protein